MAERQPLVKKTKGCLSTTWSDRPDMIKKRSIGKSDQRLKSPNRSHYTYMCFTSVCYGDIHSGSKGGGSAPKRCRSKTSVVLWSMEAFPPRRAAALSFRSVVLASSFICSILLCGVGLYCFANKPWFYVSASTVVVVVVKDEWNYVAEKRSQSGSNKSI